LSFSLRPSSGHPTGPCSLLLVNFDRSDEPSLPVHVHFALKADLSERFFNKIKQCRRVGTRYDKLAANYLAFVQLASIRLWLRANESTP
jgi:hypothetical protein